MEEEIKSEAPIVSETKQETSQQPIIKGSQPIILSPEKEETCKVLTIATTKIAVDFKGYGIEIPITEDIEIDANTKEIKVFYTSDIGKADFKYHLKVEV